MPAFIQYTHTQATQKHLLMLFHLLMPRTHPFSFYPYPNYIYCMYVEWRQSMCWTIFPHKIPTDAASSDIRSMRQLLWNICDGCVWERDERICFGLCVSILFNVSIEVASIRAKTIGHMCHFRLKREANHYWFSIRSGLFEIFPLNSATVTRNSNSLIFIYFSVIEKNKETNFYTESAFLDVN